MTLEKNEDCAPTAKQIAQSSKKPETTIDDIAVCYKVLTGLDPESIIADRGTAIHGHSELMRVKISKTTHKLLNHAVELRTLIDEYKEQIIDEDAERVMAYVNGDTQYCPDRAQLMMVLNQYAVVLSKAPKNSWKEIMYGGADFEQFFNRKELGSRIEYHLKRIERDADKIEKVRKIQFVGFSNSPIVFLLWTDKRNVRFIAYARKDWAPISPVEFGGEDRG
jgi:hypothetical protein